MGLGVADAGISLFWTTAERLEMTSFTSSLVRVRVRDRVRVRISTPRDDLVHT